MKKVLGVLTSPEAHWVGDGFPVRSMFSYNSLGQDISPFLLLDHAGPAVFAPAQHRRGVGPHPHRGFETVTIVYEGEVEHRDSTGAGGVIRPGDVQWMTAASGILHEEFHSGEFTRRGGALDMVQLWVNLPARDKMAAPRYQAIVDADIPAIPLPGDAGSVRVIAGEYDGHRGPAQTFTAIDVWDLRMRAGGLAKLQLPQGHTALLVVLRGTLRVNEADVVHGSQVALLERQGSELLLEASTDASFLVLTGEPIDEPIVGYGPFVMNTAQEIAVARSDFAKGRFGGIPR
ncbi:pirin family protein [Ramlibacter sp.]|uniref:pirin family protein n=1 Tax=Ramlibacter sp. TaxID=1917967 RepID=UPI002603A905|nr:pirin family protein [Ramlibacter sp.]MDB5954519.1 quercetin 2,3-dioxygenase [Ramlibacter sp.]